MSSYRYAHLLIVDAIVFRQLVEIYVLGVHLHCLERVPKVGYRLAFAHHLVLSVTNVCHKSSFLFPNFASAVSGLIKILLPQKVSVLFLQGSLLKYDLQGGDFSKRP